MILSSYGMAAANLRGAETPFVQIEPAMTYQYGLPMLLVIQEGAQAEGIWRPGIIPKYVITWYNSQTVEQFFARVEWKELLKNWAAKVRSGYYRQTQPEFQYMCKESG